MKRILCLLFFLVLVIMDQKATAITAVYNLRVANTSSEKIDFYEQDKVKNAPSLLTTKIYTQFRTNKRGDDQALYANVSNYIFTKKEAYFRIDGAFGYVREKNAQEITRHVQGDDILLSLGYRHKVKPHILLSYTAITGIPLHKDFEFEYFQLGTGHYALGAQFDAIFTIKNVTHSLLTAARCIHFFPRKIDVLLDTTCIAAHFALGNLIDLLVAYYKKITPDHDLEIGYNPVFACNIHLHPALDQDLPSYGIRSTWYTIYRYKFTRGKYTMGVAASLSYGNDVAPSHFDGAMKRVVGAWLSYTIRF